MSKGGMKEFLSALFASEGGADPKIVNYAGYIGKYQFGESAMADMGYYISTGADPKASGTFLYKWEGNWTGKNGVKSRSDFLNSVAVQDQAAEEWVRLLCKRARSKRYRADRFYGLTMKGFTVTESGVLAAVHLKGFGNKKQAGVQDFLESNGATDAADGLGTRVSDYMRKFAGYELGCCTAPVGQEPWSYPFPNFDGTEVKDAGAYIGLPSLNIGALAKTHDGFYPVGANGLWHGGIHFDAGSGTSLNQFKGVRCVKDGEIVAYMINKQYPEIEFGASKKRAAYSSGFALVRHRLELPAPPPKPEEKKESAKAGTAKTAAVATSPSKTDKSPPPSSEPAKKEPEKNKVLVFYSLYMHLLDFHGYELDRKLDRPAYWDASNEFIVGDKAKDQQAPDPALIVEPEVAEPAEPVCDCEGSHPRDFGDLGVFSERSKVDELFSQTPSTPERMEALDEEP